MAVTNINIDSQILTFANLAAFPVTGTVKTIYIAEDTDISYYWDGAAYQNITIDTSGLVPAGLITSSGLTMNTARLLGRGTAGVGAVEEIVIGSGLTLTGTTLSALTGITIGTTAIASGAVGRVLFEGSGNVVQQDGGFVWNNTDKRLILGADQASVDTNPRLVVVGKNPSGTTILAAFHNSTGNNNALIVRDDGNVSFGSASPPTNTQVFIQGMSNTFTDFSFGVRQLNGTDVFFIRNNGQVQIGNIFNSNDNLTVQTQIGVGATNSGTRILASQILMNTVTAPDYRFGGEALAKLNNSSANTVGINVINVNSISSIRNVIQNGFKATTGTVAESGLTAISYTAAKYGEEPNSAWFSNYTEEAGTIPIMKFWLASNNQLNTQRFQWISTTGVNMGNSGKIMTLLGNGNLLLGTSTDVASSILTLESTTKGFLPPRMTGAQAEAIATPAEGLMVYATNAGAGDITAKGWWGYDGTNWVQLN
jgi:hypothetical protein